MKNPFDGKKDIFTINQEKIKRNIIPNGFFDNEGNPLYNSFSSQTFSNMSEKDLDFWIEEITDNLRLKWSEAQKEKAKKDV